MSALFHQLTAFTIGGLTVGCLYALIAFGYTIVYRILGLFNFAHGGVFMVGTFSALFVTNELGTRGGLSIGSATGTLAVMALAAIVVCVILSVALEYGIYRPIRIRGGGGLPALVAGFGAISFLQEIFGLWQGRSPVNVTQPVGSGELVRIFNGAIHPTELIVFVVTVMTLVALQRYMALSRMGRALRAVGQDSKTAALMGINAERVIVLSFVLAGATAGIAAVLSNVYYGSTSYFSGFDLGLKGLTAALLGGMGSVSGALVGGLVLGILESYGGAVFGAQWQDVIAFGSLILILVLRPTGIIGERMALVRA